MSRRARRAFAAPFVLTALAACGGGSAPQHTQNPPEPHQNPPAQHAPPSISWTVSQTGDGSCWADQDLGDDSGCPPDTECNPPAPLSIICPEGITIDAGLRVFPGTDGGCLAAPLGVDDGGGTPTPCPDDYRE